MIVPILGLFIPIIAIVLTMGIGMLSIVLQYRRRREMFALYHQERMTALEKGVDLPPLPDGLFRERCRARQERSGHASLAWGLILSFGGIALFIALHYNNREDQSALFALIPLGIGLALLVFYFAVGRRRALALEAEMAAKAAAETQT